MPKIKFIDNPANYEYVTNKVLRCRKANIIEDIAKYQAASPSAYLYLRGIEFVKGGGLINDEYLVSLEVYKPKQAAKCLEDEVNRLKEQLQNAEQRLEQYKQSIVFIPIEKQPFWFLDSSGNAINEFYTASCDEPKVKFGNCFRYADEATVASKQILVTRRLKALARELNKGLAIDWGNTKEKKYYISMDFSNDNKEGIIKLNCTTFSRAAGVIYCLDDKFLQSALEVIGEEDLTDYLKWN